MSFNIDRWKTKTLDGEFSVPLSAFYGGIGYHKKSLDVKIEDPEAMIVSVTGFSEGFKVWGHLRNQILIIDQIENYGEGSGILEVYLNEVVFPKSKGLLVAALTWEDGSFYRLTVNNGVVTEEEIDV
jgi:hypothetical protein